jgi:release factor glutamine methyltransferase
MPESEHLDVRVLTCEDVYGPAEDTFLFMDSVAQIQSKRCLEIGTGTGMVAILLAKNGNEVTATDVNPKAISCAKKNGQANGVSIKFKRADLFKGIEGKFDVIVFNPPYLPTAAEDKVKGPLNRALDGGPDGLAVTRRFLKDSKAHLNKNGELYTIISSLSPQESVDRLLTGFASELVGASKLFFEEIRVFRLKMIQ